MKNFEVPAGGFSFDDRLFLFIAREKLPRAKEERGVMRASHLAVSVGPDPSDNFKHLFNVSLNLSNLTVLPAGLQAMDFPAREWLVHIAPVRVRNAEWPDLPSDKGEGLLLFGTDLYLSANVRLAWASLIPGQPPPPPGTWMFYMGENAAKKWQTVADVIAGFLEPCRLLQEAEKIPMLGELSVSWSPALRRWIMTSEGGRIRFARRPQGPWSTGANLFDGDDPTRSADNIAPDNTRRWLRIPSEEDQSKLTISYAPYHVPSWTRVDRSLREVTIYYTLSVEHPPYNVQLMRSRLEGN